MGKQKVVMRLAMRDAKKRSRALQIVAGAPGLLSVALEGEHKDRIVVIGDGIDSCLLTTKLRKRMGYAELVSVAPVEEKKEKESKTDGKGKNEQPMNWPDQIGVQAPYLYEIREASYNQCCCIM